MWFKPKKQDQKHFQDHFMDFVSRVALPFFLDGRLGYARILQEVFALDAAQHYHIEVANAYEQLLSRSSIKQMLFIEENSRHYLEYYEVDISQLWKPNWQNIDMSRTRFRHLSDAQYISVLKMGTFHADGYCRQSCLEALATYPDTLPFFILRMNDWVPQIREEAFLFACKRLDVCDIHELSSALPMLDKLRDSRRRKTEYLSKIEGLFSENIASKTQTMEPDKIHTYDITIKNAIYRFVNRNPVLSLEAMETLLQYERESYGKRMVIRGILDQYDCDFKRIQGYLKNKSGVVRYEALMFWYYNRVKEPWAGLSELLMDKTKKIRLEVSYILEKHKVLDVLDYYRNEFTRNVSVIAICGIGEHGSESDIALINPCLVDGNEQIAKAALSAYINLIADKGEDIYWTYLLDSRAGIRKRAFLAIKKFDIHYGAEVLYNEFQKQDDAQIRNYLLELLCTEPSTWGRLPYLLKLWGSDKIYRKQGYRLSIAINDRSMYGHVSQDEAQQIRTILDELSRTKPKLTIEKLRKGIEFDLQFVIK